MRRVTAREASQRSEVLSAIETGEQVVITKRRSADVAAPC
jgi:antitoxin (DNA-binding transcriptional repressor) of toxin-antitoxin stability system